MPLLPAEPTCFPANLFEDDSKCDRSWWVLHTHPRQEKSLARLLLRKEISFYLPTVPRRLAPRGRRMTSYPPLFSSYLFMLGGVDDRHSALATARVVRVLPVSCQEGMWRDLRQIAQLIASGSPITPEDRLCPGQRVEIHSGPLAGLHGKIVRSVSGCRFVVEVDFIQRGASVVLEDYHLSVLAESGVDLAGIS